jgi:REP element-mobilizing transposase RayT
MVSADSFGVIYLYQIISNEFRPRRRSYMKQFQTQCRSYKNELKYNLFIKFKLEYMSSTFSQIYIQIVFAVKNRKSLIHETWEEELYKYTTGVIKNKGQKLLAINGMPDHIHIFIGMKPTCCLSDLVREIKKSSNEFIKEKKFTKFKFQWQEGFGAFSYSHSALDKVINYIKNQKTHHQKKSFKVEYLEFLKAFDIEYKEEYLFEWFED